MAKNPKKVSICVGEAEDTPAADATFASAEAEAPDAEAPETDATPGAADTVGALDAPDAPLEIFFSAIKSHSFPKMRRRSHVRSGSHKARRQADAADGHDGQTNAEICPPVRCITRAKKAMPDRARGQSPVSRQLGARQTRKPECGTRRGRRTPNDNRFREDNATHRTASRERSSLRKTPTPRQRKPSRPRPAESDPKLSPKQTDAEQGRTAKTWRIGAGKMEEPPRRCGEKTTREKAALNSQGPYQQRKRGKHSL